jgi:hypothetical protein
MAKFKPQTINLGPKFFGMTFALTKSDREIAQEVFIELDTRRILTHHPDRAPNQLPDIVRSALKIRDLMTQKLQDPMPGPILDRALRLMRLATLEFIETAGRDGDNLRDNPIEITRALTRYHTKMGFQLGPLANQYCIQYEAPLGRLIPPEEHWVIPPIKLPKD